MKLDTQRTLDRWARQRVEDKKTTTHALLITGAVLVLVVSVVGLVVGVYCRRARSALGRGYEHGTTTQRTDEEGATTFGYVYRG